MSPTEPLIMTLHGSNTNREAKNAIRAARAEVGHAKAALLMAAATQHTDYSNLGAFVQTNSNVKRPSLRAAATPFAPLVARRRRWRMRRAISTPA